MPTWHKDESNHRGHVKFRKAGFWASLIVEHCWRVALMRCPETADITQFWDADYFAVELQWPPELQHEIEPAMARAIEVRLIDVVDGRIYVHDWHDWQPVSEFTSKAKSNAERQREHRARKRGLAPLPQPDLPGILGHAPTPPETDQREEIDEREEIGNVTCNGPPLHSVTNDAHAQRFCSLFDDLASKDNPSHQRYNPSDVSRTEIALKQLCNGEPLRALEMAMEVARWAFERSETWKDGGHWREVLTSPARFWDKWVTLVAQFNRKPRPVKGEPVHRVTGIKIPSRKARRADER